MGSYTAAEVRGFATRIGNGEKLDSDRTAAVERTANQAGSEGRKVNELMGGNN